MNSEDDRRLDRLVGSRQDESGGGFELPTLFTVVLQEILDHGQRTAEELVPRVSTAQLNKTVRAQKVYGSKKPWFALTDDLLRQLEYESLVVRSGTGWIIGSAFQDGTSLTVVHERPGKHGPITTTVYSAKEREERELDENQRLVLTSLASRLREDGPGLRPVDVHRVAELQQKIYDHGYSPAFPIIKDQYGRILDGRHRLVAAKNLGIVPAVNTIEVQDDEEAVAIAWEANEGRTWSKKERQYIEVELRAAGLTPDQLNGRTRRERRAAIRAKLNENPTASARSIARELGVSHVTVGAVKQGGQTDHPSPPAKTQKSPARTSKKPDTPISDKEIMEAIAAHPERLKGDELAKFLRKETGKPVSTLRVRNLIHRRIQVTVHLSDMEKFAGELRKHLTPADIRRLVELLTQ